LASRLVNSTIKCAVLIACAYILPRYLDQIFAGKRRKSRLVAVDPQDLSTDIPPIDLSKASIADILEWSIMDFALPIQQIRIETRYGALQSSTGQLTRGLFGHMSLKIEQPQSVAKDLAVESIKSGLIERMDQEYVIKARTSDGCEFEANASVVAGISVRTGDYHFEPYRVTLRRPGLKKAGPQITGFIEHLPVEIYPPFPSQNFSIQIGAVKFTAERTHLGVDSASVSVSNASDEDVLLYAGAYLYALGFASGYRIIWQTVALSMNDKEEIVIQERPLGKYPFYQPIFLGIQNDAYRLIEQTMKYLVEHPKGALGYFLGECWEAAGPSLALSELVLGTAIEGLSSEVISGADNKDKSFNQFKEKVCESIDGCGESKDSGFRERLKHLVKSAAFLTARDTIKVAGKKLGLEVTDTETQEWSMLRVPRSHGQQPWEEISQERIDRYFACLDLFYRMVLKMVDYTGNRNPYGKGS